MTMQLFGALILAGMLCTSLSQEDRIFKSYKKGNEMILVIEDGTTGRKVTEIDVFEDKGYQLGKPADENICLVSRFLVKADDSPTCFKRIPAMDIQEEMQIDLTECEDRDITFLEPTECRQSDMDMESESEDGPRQKRNSNCKRKYTITYCKDFRFECADRGWWNICIKFKYGCLEYGTRDIETNFCF